MKLYITVPSPYARKCRIVAREKGLADRIEEIAVDPYANAPELLASNPLVQVPTLIAEDGLPLNDSPVICEYLDALGAGPRLLPEGGPERLRVRRMETLEQRLAHISTPMSLSIIGCVVNGPGEALFTDVGFTGGGKGSGMVYLNGKTAHKLANEGMVDHIVELVEAKAAELEAKKIAAE